jgi:hypothetical protein
VKRTFENRIVRPVRVFTGLVTIDGILTVGLGGRTLDELNQGARAYLTLTLPLLVTGQTPLEKGPLSINKSNIIFALEIPDLGAKIESQPMEPEVHRARSVVRIRTADYTIEGYVHTWGGGDALGRLTQPGTPRFLALSPATIAGPDIDCAVSFVAVNCAHVTMAQEILSIDAQPEESAPGAGGAAA